MTCLLLKACHCKLPLSRALDLQMADFVSSDDDAGESTGVLDDGYAVDFLETLVNDTGSSNVGKSCIGGI